MKNETKRRIANLVTVIVVLLALSTFAAKTAAHIGNARSKSIERWINEMISGETAPDLQRLQQEKSLALPYLVKALSTEDSLFRQGYMWLWSRLPGSIASALPSLLPADEIRANAASIIGQLGPAAEPAV